MSASQNETGNSHGSEETEENPYKEEDPMQEEPIHFEAGTKAVPLSHTESKLHKQGPRNSTTGFQLISKQSISEHIHKNRETISTRN